MSKINQLKAGAVLSYFSMGIGFFISIIYTPIMLRLLGQSEYGLYNLVASVVSYLGLFSFGFGSAYIRYYSRYRVKQDQENIAKLNGMFLIIFVFIGLVAFLAGLLLVFNIDVILGNKISSSELSTAKILMGILAFNIALSFLASVFNSYITANEQYIFQKVIQIIKVVVSPFVILPILLMGYKSIGMVIATTTINVLIEIVNIIFCFKKLKIRFAFNQFDFLLMREMTVFSSFIFMNMVIDQINWNVDKYILGRYRGTVSVAVYGIAAQLNTYYLSLSTAISSVFIPRVHRIVATTNNNKELTELFTRIGRVQFLILSLIFLGFIFFGKPFINFWAGPNYSESYYIALILIISATIPLIQNIGIEIQKAKNMHHFRSWVYLFIALLNITISIPLAKMYGGIGTALGTAISLIIGNGLIMNIYYSKRVMLNIKYFWYQILKIIPSLLPPVIIGIITLAFVESYNILTLLLCIFLFTLVFCLSIWFMGMNQYEKSLIGEPIKRILIKLQLKKH